MLQAAAAALAIFCVVEPYLYFRLVALLVRDFRVRLVARLEAARFSIIIKLQLVVVLVVLGHLQAAAAQMVVPVVVPLLSTAQRLSVEARLVRQPALVKAAAAAVAQVSVETAALVQVVRQLARLVLASALAAAVDAEAQTRVLVRQVKLSAVVVSQVKSQFFGKGNL
jgi:hypothetical protein